MSDDSHIYDAAYVELVHPDKLREAQQQLAQAAYWRNFWRSHADTHERMWREVEELRQKEGQEAAAALTAAQARIVELEAELATAYKNLEDAQSDVAAEIERADELERQVAALCVRIEQRNCSEPPDWGALPAAAC